MFREIEDIFFIDEIFMEFFHLNICFFTHNEHSNAMVGLYIVEVGDKWRNELENKHNIVTLVDVILFIL